VWVCHFTNLWEASNLKSITVYDSKDSNMTNNCKHNNQTERKATYNRGASVGLHMILTGSCILGLMNAFVDSHEVNFTVLAMLDNRNGG
jgi:hypothetical protein